MTVFRLVFYVLALLSVAPISLGVAQAGDQRTRLIYVPLRTIMNLSGRLSNIEQEQLEAGIQQLVGRGNLIRKLQGRKMDIGGMEYSRVLIVVNHIPGHPELRLNIIYRGQGMFSVLLTPNLPTDFPDEEFKDEIDIVKGLFSSFNMRELRN